MAEQEKYHEFDDGAVNEALSLAQEHAQSMTALAGGGHAAVNLADSGEMFLSAQCISVSVQNRKICLNLPLGIGRVCVPIPSGVPNGTAAQACIGICTTWGIPTGVKLTISSPAGSFCRKAGASAERRRPLVSKDGGVALSRGSALPAGFLATIVAQPHLSP